MFNQDIADELANIERALGHILSAIEGETPERDEKSNLFPHYRLDNFIVGDSNREAVTTVAEVMEHFSTQVPQKLLYIYGPHGSGKTHLAHALANGLHDLYQADAYCASVEGLSMNSEQEIDTMGQADVIIIEDIQTFGGFAEFTVRISAAIEQFVQQGKIVVLTCNTPPSGANCFKGGDISPEFYEQVNAMTAIQLHDDASIRRDILQQKIRHSDIDVNPEDVAYDAEMVAETIQALKKVFDYAMTAIQNHQYPLTEDEPVGINILNIDEWVDDYGVDIDPVIDSTLLVKY